MTDVLEKIKDLLEPILQRETLSLYDIEIVKGGGGDIVRIFINKEGGINVDHCKSVSHNLSATLEVEEIFHGHYTLEVSSPGLTRKLKKLEHFLKSEGSLARISFKKPFDGPEKAFGELETLGDGRFRITNKSNGNAVEFSFENVAKAKLEFE